MSHPHPNLSLRRALAAAGLVAAASSAQALDLVLGPEPGRR